MRKSILAATALLTACASAPAYKSRGIAIPVVQPQYAPSPSSHVVSVSIEPPLYQPAPMRLRWAPPPMLVESVTDQPFPEAVWIGGYWVWEGNWVWARGRWSSPPRRSYTWVNPFYENCGDSVLFVSGFWAAPGVDFIRPVSHVNVTFAQISPGVIAGPLPIGPLGVFVPPPPGSRYGLIVPAPIGTAPAVVVGVLPVINEGMRIEPNDFSHVAHLVPTTAITNRISNISNINNITNVRVFDNATTISNVTIVAPASATASGRAVYATVPAQAYRTTTMVPVGRGEAPSQAAPQAAGSGISGSVPTKPLEQAVAQKIAPPGLTVQGPALHVPSLATSHIARLSGNTVPAQTASDRQSALQTMQPDLLHRDLTQKSPTSQRGQHDVRFSPGVPFGVQQATSLGAYISPMQPSHMDRPEVMQPMREDVRGAMVRRQASLPSLQHGHTEANASRPDQRPAGNTKVPPQAANVATTSVHAHLTRLPENLKPTSRTSGNKDEKRHYLQE